MQTYPVTEVLLCSALIQVQHLFKCLLHGTVKLLAGEAFKRIGHLEINNGKSSAVLSVQSML